jgi:pimeloyl-ACP methyl ester carboxylesterase
MRIGAASTHPFAMWLNQDLTAGIRYKQLIDQMKDVAAQLLIFWGSIPKGYPGFKHNPVAYAQRVQCPTLMLHGTHDPRATLQEGMAVFRSLSGPKQFEVFEGAGHEGYLAAQPGQWRHAVAQFCPILRTLDQGPGI